MYGEKKLRNLDSGGLVDISFLPSFLSSFVIPLFYSIYIYKKNLLFIYYFIFFLLSKTRVEGKKEEEGEE